MNKKIKQEHKEENERLLGKLREIQPDVEMNYHAIELTKKDKLRFRLSDGNMKFSTLMEYMKREYEAPQSSLKGDRMKCEFAIYNVEMELICHINAEPKKREPCEDFPFCRNKELQSLQGSANDG